MSDQDTGGYAADASRDRCDRLNKGFHVLKSDVTGDTAFFGVPVDAHIDDDLPGVCILLCDTVELTGGGDQDVRLSGDRRDIHCTCVAVDDSRVFMHQHHAHGASDDQRAPDDGSLFAFDRYIKVMEDFHGGLCRAGREAGLGVCEDTGQGKIRAAVYILGGIEHLTGFFIVQLSGKGTEKKDAVDAVVLVEIPERPVKDLLSDVAWEDHFFDSDANGLGPLCRASLIGQIVRPLPHPEYAESGCDAGFFQRLCIFLHLCGKGIRDFFASQYFSH